MVDLLSKGAEPLHDNEWILSELAAAIGIIVVDLGKVLICAAVNCLNYPSSVLPQSDAEVIKMMIDTEYGLTNAVFTADSNRLQKSRDYECAS